ncbi:MAG: hypothetical protein IKZ41_04520 [Clostridia bacterium]|nr:hypothetical protein [Clostridia bacterium]
MRDIITQAAISYCQLTKYRYDFICGRKGSKITVSLAFPHSAFYHLAGFQYVKLGRVQNKMAACHLSLLGEISDEQLRKNRFAHFDRLECLISLKQMIEENHIREVVLTCVMDPAYRAQVVERLHKTGVRIILWSCQETEL